MNHIFLETRMLRLSDGEEIMTLDFFVLIQYRSVTDRRTDGQTDGHSSSGYTSACIACYANALVKSETKAESSSSDLQCSATKSEVNETKQQLNTGEIAEKL